MSKSIELIPATIADYPTIQNIAQFYVYDASRDCGFSISKGGLYEPSNYKSYFEERSKKAYLIKVENEIAGFALLNQRGYEAKTNWKIDQFFILTKFQGKGIGKLISHQIWDMYPGYWEVSVIPKNHRALHFWKKAISVYTHNNFNYELRTVDFDEYYPERIILSFCTTAKCTFPGTHNVTICAPAGVQDIEAMVTLSYKKRRAYEKAQPQFWKYAGPSAEEAQSKWFKEILEREGFIFLVAKINNQVKGFVIGQLINSPAVYNPRNVHSHAPHDTLMIDDFCIAETEVWQSVGELLLSKIKGIALSQGAIQHVIVCGAHDLEKNNFLQSHGLGIASNWYVGKL